MSTVRSLSVHVSLGVVPLPSGSLTQCVDLKWARIILLDPELWWFLSFEICEDAGNELTSVLWRPKLLFPRQKVPDLITAWGFAAFVCSVLLVCARLYVFFFVSPLHSMFAWDVLSTSFCFSSIWFWVSADIRCFGNTVWKKKEHLQVVPWDYWWIDRCLAIESYLKLHLLVTGSYLL